MGLLIIPPHTPSLHAPIKPSALSSVLESDSAALRTVQAALEESLKYTRIVQSTEIPETALHNYRHAEMAWEKACLALHQASAPPVELANNLEELAVHLERIAS